MSATAIVTLCRFLQSLGSKDDSVRSSQCDIIFIVLHRSRLYLRPVIVRHRLCAHWRKSLLTRCRSKWGTIILACPSRKRRRSKAHLLLPFLVSRSYLCF